MSRAEDADSRFKADLERAMALSLESAVLETAARAKRQGRDFPALSRPLASTIRMGPRRASTPETMAYHRQDSSGPPRLASNYSGLAFPSLSENPGSTAEASTTRPRPSHRGGRNASSMLLPSPSRRQSAPHEVRSSTPIREGSAPPESLSSRSTWGEDRTTHQTQDSKNNNLIDFSGGFSKVTKNGLLQLYDPNHNHPQVPALVNAPLVPTRFDSLSSAVPSHLAIQYSGPNSMPPGGNFNCPSNLTVQPASLNGAQGLSKSISWSEGNPLSQQTARPGGSFPMPIKRESFSDYTLKNKASDSLIDFGQLHLTSQMREQEKQLTRVSVVNFFDPLLAGENEVEVTKETFLEDEGDAHDPLGVGNRFSEVESSFLNPFEYMSNRSEQSFLGRSTDLDPFEQSNTNDKTDSGHNLSETISESSRAPTKVKSTIEILPGLHKEKDVTMDKEIVAFAQMVKDVRSKFKFDEKETNPGIVNCPKIVSPYPLDTCVKIVVHWSSGLNRKHTNFTSLVTNKVEMLIGKAVVDLINSEGLDTRDFSFQVMGSIEVLDPNACLKDFEHVHQCYKFDRDVEFELIHRKDMILPYLRTAEDDKRALNIRIEDISPKDQTKTLSYDDLHIVLDNLRQETETMKKGVESLKSGSQVRAIEGLCPQKVSQSVKLVCAKLGLIETLDVSKAMDSLLADCIEFDQSPDSLAFSRQSARHNSSNKHVNEVINYAHVEDESISKKAERILEGLDQLTHAVQQSLVTYSKSFRVNFSFSYEEDQAEIPILSEVVEDSFFFHVDAVHRLDSSWFYDDYSLRVDLYHGFTCIMHPLYSPFRGLSESFYPWIKLDHTMDLQKAIALIPREARLVFTLTGRRVIHKGEEAKTIKKELGWASLQLFSFDRHLVSGSYFLTLWSPEAQKRLGPAPDSGSHPNADTCPLLSIKIPEWERPVATKKDSGKSDIISKVYPELYPKSWDLDTLPELYAFLQMWKRPEPMDILQLFLPIFPDDRVRRCAIEWMAEMTNDEIIDYLPQLLEALKHETWSNSPLACLLLERSLTSPRIAHYLYWYLTQSLPGNTPQNTSEERICEVRVARYRRRLQMLMRALLVTVGEAMENSFHKQTNLLLLVNDAAKEVKKAKDASKMMVLRKHMEIVNQHLRSTQTALPLSPGRIACGVDVNQCDYFKSNTVPLKIMFETRDNFVPHGGHSESRSSPEGSPGFDQTSFSTLESSSIAPVIFKRGDDLRQDSLAMQLIRVMEKIWLSEDQNLKMVTFSCVPTGDCEGMIELVRQAKTLREIQTAHGMNVPLRVQSIQEWLQKYNQSPLEYARAVKNFTEAELFINFKRDRTPFVLSQDMAYVINGGEEKPAQMFQDFMNLCCKGFNILRKNGNLLVNLVALMTSSGIRGIGSNAVEFVRNALLPDLSNNMAYVINGGEEKPAQMFQDFMNLCCKGFNILRKNGNLLVNLVALVSICLQGRVTDGAITDVKVVSVQKRYSPDKHYMFILQVKREGVKDMLHLFRSYKEFCELESKI
eukprot:TCALIF_06692-PA protein Name:"Similar to Pik3c2a Phosphatidylinositol 4-phosphate 3-kinase C2 domain-containing subunit alpha (Mus musculus)" AED:0.07 eAED:0.07 QI:217/0.70/0.61/1/0.64/0.55/18/0/1515